LRTDPRRIRAARRATLPVVREREPRTGHHHPASAADVRDALRRFGEDAYYGIRTVELIPAPTASETLPLGRLIEPGRIVLYDQPLTPWRLGFDLPAEERSRLHAAGAITDRAGIVVWPGASLRRFMVAYVLAHELGHHMVQHERRLRGEAAARTRDHEARAEAIARRLRARLD
jgi:hypothetical protein